MRPVGAADWRRLPTVLLRTLSHAHVFLNFVFKRLIKFNYWGVRWSYVQIDLFAPQRNEAIFNFPDESRRDALPLVRLKDGHCIYPPTMAIVTSDDRRNRGTDHHVSIDRNKEQVRLHAQVCRKGKFGGSAGRLGKPAAKVA
jgi:hypothetical protein